MQSSKIVKGNNKNRRMKKLLTIAVIAILLLPVGGCQHRNYSIKVYNGLNYTTIHCDSFQMKSTKHALIWVDGTIQEVYAVSYLSPYNNEFQNNN